MTKMPLKRTLTVFRGADCWMVRDPDPQVSFLFGTDTLPTGWTLAARVEDVAEGLRALNPECEIVVQGEIESRELTTANYAREDFMRRLLANGTREQIIDWLCWNDRNGCYSDSDAELEGLGHLTLETARGYLAKFLGPEYSTPIDA